MGNIERWWRVIGQNGRSTWLDVDPEAKGMMQGAWHRAEVHGPFVLEAQHAGAVEALRELAEEARRFSTAADYSVTRDIEDDFVAALDEAERHLGGQYGDSVPCSAETPVHVDGNDSTPRDHDRGQT